MHDMQVILNPTGLQDDLVPNAIQHYPIINSKLNILRGEESKRLFDYKAIVTDPNSISEASNEKKALLLQDLQELVQNTAISEEQANQKLEELNHFKEVHITRAGGVIASHCGPKTLGVLFYSR